MDLKSTITREIIVSSPIHTDTTIEVESPINLGLNLESGITEVIDLTAIIYADVYAMEV